MFLHHIIRRTLFSNSQKTSTDICCCSFHKDNFYKELKKKALFYSNRCFKGVQGFQGPRGHPGPPGLDGLEGNIGAPGLRGSEGDFGDPGVKGVRVSSALQL